LQEPCGRQQWPCGRGSRDGACAQGGLVDKCASSRCPQISSVEIKKRPPQAGDRIDGPIKRESGQSQLSWCKDSICLESIWSLALRRAAVGRRITLSVHAPYLG